MTVYLSALGIACTLGRGKEEVIKALFQNEKVVAPLHSEHVLLSGKNVPVGRVPFELPEVPEKLKSLNSRNNRLLKTVLDEIKDAVEDCIVKYGASRVGIVMATSTSGMYEQELAFLHKQRTGELLGKYDPSQAEMSSPSLFAALYLGLKGPAYTLSTACSSSGKALCSAKRLINANICDAVIVGGVDTLCSLTLNGFDSLGLLSNQACNPFSKNRAGITIGEGAAVFIASRDGTTAEIELSGCGESSDAYHISCPEPQGRGSEVAIRAALNQSGLSPQDICYLNLHGTGTDLNDAMESISLHRIFGGRLPCSSTKALTGHTLGAAGAIEAAILWLALSLEEKKGIPLPPHVWDGEPDPTLPPLNFCNHGEFASPIRGVYALMSNSFAFGGSNVSLILKRKINSALNGQAAIPLTEILPHEFPMILIDRVISFQEESIHCQVEITAHSPFCENGAVPSYISIEYMAQAIAAWNGLMSRSKGEKPKVGFLLGSRRLELNVPSFMLGEVLDVYGKVQYLDGEMASFDCCVKHKGVRVVQASLNVFQPKVLGGLSE